MCLFWITPRGLLVLVHTYEFHAGLCWQYTLISILKHEKKRTKGFPGGPALIYPPLWCCCNRQRNRKDFEPFHQTLLSTRSLSLSLSQIILFNFSFLPANNFLDFSRGVVMFFFLTSNHLKEIRPVFVSFRGAEYRRIRSLLATPLNQHMIFEAQLRVSLTTIIKNRPKSSKVYSAI